MKKRYISSILKIATCLVACAWSVTPIHAASDVSIKISMDSAHLLMGKQTALHVEIQKPLSTDGTLLLPADTLVKEVEIAGTTNPDTTVANGHDLIRMDIVLQSFDSGLYPIGPIKYLTSGGDTVLSNPLSLKVFPADVDSLETIHGIAPIEKAPSKWWDFIPDVILDYWLYCIILILIALAGIAAWLILKKKVAVPFMPKAKPVSPYDAAMSSLDTLKEKHLCENGMEKEYYTELTDILRKYLEGRFGINAMEMTSTQILDTLGKDEEISSHKDLVARILEIADYVKFAKVRPLPDDNVAAWDNARKFVTDTKPVETELPQDAVQAGNTGDNTKTEE